MKIKDTKINFRDDLPVIDGEKTLILGYEKMTEKEKENSKKFVEDINRESAKIAKKMQEDLVKYGEVEIRIKHIGSLDVKEYSKVE